MTTTIRIKRETKARLDKISTNKKDTYDSIINYLIDNLEE